MKMQKPLGAVLSAGLVVNLCAAQETPQLKDDKAKINYSVGYQIGSDFRRQGVEIDAEVLVRGIRDALSGAEASMTPQEMRSALMALQKNVASDDVEKPAKTITNQGDVRTQGRKFLAENAKKEGVKTTASGLQYKVIREGTGRTPGINDTVTVNYRGTLIDGTEFDSSYRRGEPATFRVDQVIAGWTEALQMMKEGAKWELFIPSQLAYPRGGPLEHRTLLFDVELIKVGPSEADKAAASQPAAPSTDKPKAAAE